MTVKALSLVDANIATATSHAGGAATGCRSSASAYVGAQVHAINPMIYGANSYDLDPLREVGAVWLGPILGEELHHALQLRAEHFTNAGIPRQSFENKGNASQNHPEFGDFNDQFAQDKAVGAKTICTVPVIGWVAKTRSNSCSFSVAKYGQQSKTDPQLPDCGNGLRPDMTKITTMIPTTATCPSPRLGLATG